MNSDEDADSRLLMHWRNVTLTAEEERLEGGPFIRLMRDNYYAFIGYSVALIAATILLIIVLKIYLKRRWNITCCTGVDRGRGGARGAQIRSDAAMAAELQRELDAEAKQLALERRRAARRKEMAIALSDATMVVNDEHLLRAEGDDHNDDDDDGDDGVDLEAGTDGGGELVLRIPGKDGTSTQQRDGHCAICLGDYEPGDTVIWSLNDECTHAFHDDCILTWLSRNKKKCPCCRLEFIPQDHRANAKDGKEVDSDSGVDAAPSAETADDSAVFVEEEEMAGSPQESGRGDTDENDDDDDDQQLLAEIVGHRRASLALDISEEEQERGSSGDDDVV